MRDEIFPIFRTLGISSASIFAMSIQSLDDVVKILVGCATLVWLILKSADLIRKMKREDRGIFTGNDRAGEGGE